MSEKGCVTILHHFIKADILSCTLLHCLILIQHTDRYIIKYVNEFKCSTLALLKLERVVHNKLGYPT